MKQARTRTLRSLGLAALAAAAIAPATAQDWRPASFFVQGGVGEDDVGVASAGVQWPWAWRRNAVGGELSVQTELFLGLWRADALGGGKRNVAQLGLVPMLRYRFDQGRSPWFVEGGIGLSVTDRRFVTPTKDFSTRWNFSDNLGAGFSFGADRSQEVSLRLQHSSNGGAKKPNPGLNLVMLRYARSF